MLESIRRIVVPTDFTTASDVAVQSAGDIAREWLASVTLTHAVQLPVLHTPRDINVPPRVWTHLRERADADVQPLRDRLIDVGVERVDLAVSDEHRASELILRTAEATEADLIVMATHGRRGLSRALLGSVTERTLRASRVPVLTVRDQALDLPLREILVPVDFSERSVQAYRAAARLGRRFGAGVRLLHVFTPLPESIRYASSEAAAFDARMNSEVALGLEAAAKEVASLGAGVTTAVAGGAVVDAILEHASELGAGVIVMGVSDRVGSLARILGSVARGVLQGAHCPILTLRSVPPRSVEGRS